MYFLKVINNQKIEVSFIYEESCKHIYKHFTVNINEKNSNIIGLKKYLSTPYPEILTKNFYFCKPSLASTCRRKNEIVVTKIVKDYFISEKFIII
jgi:hypothetical protein